MKSEEDRELKEVEVLDEEKIIVGDFASSFEIRKKENGREREI